MPPLRTDDRRRSRCDPAGPRGAAPQDHIEPLARAGRDDQVRLALLPALLYYRASRSLVTPQLIAPTYFHPACARGEWEMLAERAAHVRLIVLNLHSGPSGEPDAALTPALDRPPRY